MELTVQTFLASLSGVGAFIGALALAYRGLSGDRFTRRVSESAALLTGYTEMVKNLRVEIGEIRKDHELEIERNKKQCQEDQDRMGRHHKLELDSIMMVYAEERKEWDAERTTLSNQVSQLTEMLEELRTQVYLLNNPLPDGETETTNE